MKRDFKRKSIFWFKSLILIASATCFSSCGLWGNESNVDETLLAKYQQYAHPAVNAQLNDNIDCFVDYSCGMEEGMKATAAVNDKLKNFLGGKKVTYYKVGASDDPPAIDVNAVEGNFLNVDNFKQPGSKLKVAVDRITANKNKTGIFITDFERVEDAAIVQNLVGAPSPHPIDDKAWAQTNFREWLLAGNQIDIFAKQYSKPDYWFDKSYTTVYPNWIYTIVFTPNKIIKTEELYKTSVLKFLTDEYQKASDADSKHFSYTVNNFKIELGKTDDNIGNANDNLSPLALFVKSPETGFEFYEFKSADLVDFNADAESKDKRIINKVMVSSLASSFSDVQFGLKVYDVTHGLNVLDSTINQGAPEVSTNSENGKKDTIANKPIKYKFKQGNEINNVFDYVYNPTTKEAGIKLKPDFAGVEATTVYEIDIVVNSVKLKDFTDGENVLKLNYANGYNIKSLGESIKYAMNSAAATLNGKTLYTIYIKIDK